MSELENGDSVQIAGEQGLFTIVGTGPGAFYKLQLGNDGGTVRHVEGSKLKLMAKAAKPDTGPRFVPKRSIMED